MSTSFFHLVLEENGNNIKTLSGLHWVRQPKGALENGGCLSLWNTYISVPNHTTSFSSPSFLRPPLPPPPHTHISSPWWMYIPHNIPRKYKCSASSISIFILPLLIVQSALGQRVSLRKRRANSCCHSFSFREEVLYTIFSQLSVIPSSPTVTLTSSLLFSTPPENKIDHRP